VAAVRAIERAGCSVVCLPPYSPDFNPIELAFAKVKARLRAGRDVCGGVFIDHFEYALVLT
jgi:transposase